MKDALETINVGDLVVSLYQDDSAESPDSWGDGSLEVVTTENRYFSVHPGLPGFGTVKAEMLRDEEFSSEFDAAFHRFPLYAYIHSGVALSMGQEGQFGDQWDAAQIGFVVAGREEFSDEDKARECCAGLVETWNQYLSGQVYGFIVERDGEHVDSSWGFYGLDEAKSEGLASAESEAAQDADEQAKIALACAL
jgi:hypothetical protein